MSRNPKFGDGKFVVCHWDTFDNETITVGSAETLEKAEELVRKKYGTRISAFGADRVDIVDEAGVVKKIYSVG
jgi:hypothetical protein